MLWFEDEARFGRINNLSRCWVSTGQRAVVTQQLIREYTYAYTAVCPANGQCFSIISPVNNTDAMNIFLDQLSQKYSIHNLIIILDGAGWHTSKSLKIPANIALLRLPPYSPELNPVEHLWDYIREQKGFNNHTFNSLKHVEDQLELALKQIANENDIIKSLCNFSWIYQLS
ncbi:IS630 family transposase [Terrimonas sp.]|uniref:IS630 family transposase n=1 Tax=Terrimonas sp. TaxID=1914338 RepID=UPI0014024355|nr:IS630 family transposase [Terrimonas sp.]